MNKHRKSQSCASLISTLKKQSPSILQECRRKSEFIPFRQERQLGKLITSKSKAPPIKLDFNGDAFYERINFKNFRKMYKQISKEENQRYSVLTRRSVQDDLVNQGSQWKKLTLNKLLPAQLKSKQTKGIQGTISHENKKIMTADRLNKSKSLFEKMDQHLYKKICAVKKPPENPQFQSIYSNYIQICELNENIRREELLKKSIF